MLRKVREVEKVIPGVSDTVVKDPGALLLMLMIIRDDQFAYD